MLAGVAMKNKFVPCTRSYHLHIIYIRIKTARELGRENEIMNERDFLDMIVYSGNDYWQQMKSKPSFSKDECMVINMILKNSLSPSLLSKHDINAAVFIIYHASGGGMWAINIKYGSIVLLP